MTSAMSPGSRWVPLTLIVAIALVVGGGWRLLKSRYAAGDVHPAYSSLRSDRLGTRALHDALKSLPARPTTRLLDPTIPLDAPAKTTLLVLGWEAAETAAAPDEVVRRIEASARAGARVVIALVPQAADNWNTRRLERRAVGRRTTPTEEDPLVFLRETWGFEIAYRNLPLNPSGELEPVEATLATTPPPDAAGPARPSLEPPPEGPLPWRSGVRFLDPGPEWTRVYEVNGEAVLIARKFGAGEVILTSDAYPFSNEGLRHVRQSSLLAWYLGGRPGVAFMEFHLGLQQTPGIAHLARRYRLHGFFVGGLVLAALFVWRSVSSLVPRRSDSSRGGPLRGLHSDLGLANLIGRTIPAGDLPRVCFEEWHRSVGARDPRWDPVTAALVGVVQKESSRSRRDKDPVHAVSEMMQAIAANTPRGAAVVNSRSTLPRSTRGSHEHPWPPTQP